MNHKRQLIGVKNEGVYDEDNNTNNFKEESSVLHVVWSGPSLFHSVAFTIGVLDGKSTVLGMGTSNRRYLRRINDRRQQDRCFHWLFLKFVTSFSRGGTSRNILLLHKRERDNP